MKIVDAVDLALNLLIQAQRVSLLVSRAQLEGRSQLKPEEAKAITDERDAAIAKLEELTKEPPNES